jgi:hypothetical protein
MSNYLIITCAHKDYSSDQRKKDYLESIERAILYKNFFDKIFILECLLKDGLDYLKIDEKIEIFYSEGENFYKNYGLNELLHINLFLQKNNFIKNEDNIVKITGRYFLVENYFLKLLPTDYDIIAKKDNDIWGENSMGVHTFYLIFKKNFFKYLVDNINLVRDPSFMETYCIEEFIKKCMLKSSNCHFYEGQMGIITNFSLNNLKALT